MSKDFSNTDSTIDSRLVEAKIQELIDDLRESLEEAFYGQKEAARALAEEAFNLQKEAERKLAEEDGSDFDDESYGEFDVDVFDETYGEFEEPDLEDIYVLKQLDEVNETAELTDLLLLKEEVVSITSDWYYGVELIHEDYFVSYAKQLAEDTGMDFNDLKWPFTCIDWEEAAGELKQDYSEVEFSGEVYFVRCC